MMVMIIIWCDNDDNDGHVVLMTLMLLVPFIPLL